jgi:ribosomal protein L40E
MVFDRFKSWRKEQSQGVVCPSCQHSNQEGATVCTRCYYQLDRPSFKQTSGLGDDESSDLLDELVSEIEKQENEDEKWVAPSFSMDDVTVDVAQYEDNDHIILNQQPDFTSILNPPPSMEEEEEYELSSEDSPQFVKKFEVPESPEDFEEAEETEHKPIELVQPTAETPDHVEVVSASEVPDTNGWPIPEETTPVADPADFDGDGVVDEYEAAFASPISISGENRELPQEPRQGIPEEQVEDSELVEEPDARSDPLFELPPAPTNLPIPRLIAEPVPEQVEPQETQDTTPALPPAPVQPWDAANEVVMTSTPEGARFWPWEQQEEWPLAEVKKQLSAALRAAKEQNIAEATVLIDEVGPHIGNRTPDVVAVLFYAVGKLLMSIGRPRAVERMVEAASLTYPDSPEIVLARKKLIS